MKIYSFQTDNNFNSFFLFEVGDSARNENFTLYPRDHATAPDASVVDLLTEFADIGGRRTAATRLGAFAADFTDAKLTPPLSSFRKGEVDGIEDEPER